MTPDHTLTQRILIALVFGIVTGLILNLFGTTYPRVSTWFVDGLLLIVGKWFIALLMVLVVPLVFVSLVKAVAHLGDTARLGKLSLWTLSLYVLTTVIAISTGLAVAWA